MVTKVRHKEFMLRRTWFPSTQHLNPLLCEPDWSCHAGGERSICYSNPSGSRPSFTILRRYSVLDLHSLLYTSNARRENLIFIFSTRKRSLGQGNMFTAVFLSTGGGCLLPGGGGLVWSRGGAWSGEVPGPGGAGPGVPGPGRPGLGRPGPGGEGYLVWRWVWSWGVPGGDPPGQLLLRVVRILLECILVFGNKNTDFRFVETGNSSLRQDTNYCLPQVSSYTIYSCTKGKSCRKNTIGHQPVTKSGGTQVYYSSKLIDVFQDEDATVNGFTWICDWEGTSMGMMAHMETREARMSTTMLQVAQ